MENQTEVRPISKKLLAIIAIFLLGGLLVWGTPRRISRTVALDDKVHFAASSALSQRSIAWQPATAIPDLLPESITEASLLTPRLTKQGTVLYCTVRTPKSKQDIWRAQWMEGRWQPLAPVAELNSKADDLAAVVSSDGKYLYLSSNRAGGFGGFDLYVCEWDGNQWSKPRNLGPTINTVADEQEPSITSSGNQLLFASNRRLEAEATETKIDHLDDPTKKKAGRRQRKQSRFDLFYSDRVNPADDWSRPKPLSEVNRQESHEYSPFISPDGTRLYFTSDRQKAPGSPRHLDLYTARRTSHGFGHVQNLGPNINSAADEAEPTLSPEGFLLLFVSNRNGRDQIFTSRATEVIQEVVWDTAHLAVLSQVWPIALIFTVLAVLLGALLRARGWLTHLLAESRFLAISIIIHALLVIVLAFWSLPTVIEIIVTKVQEAEASSQPFDDNQHESHEDGQEAWEKLADLQATDTAIDLVRRETQPNNLPDQSDHLTPTISIDLARHLPSNRVLYSAPVEPTEVSQVEKPSERDMAPALAVAELVNEIDVPQLEPTVTPEEPMETQPVEIVRSQPTDAPPLEPTELPTLAKLKPIDLATALPQEVPFPNTPAELSQEITAPQVAAVAQQVVEITDATEAPIIPPAPTNRLPATLASQIQVARRPSTTSVPQLNTESEQPLRSLPRNAAPLEIVETEEEMREVLPKLTKRVNNVSLETTEVAADEPNDPLAPTPTPPISLEQNTAQINLPRRDDPPPQIEVQTPQEMAGPGDAQQRIVVGELADVAVDVPPAFGPIVSRLDRPRAKATRVVYAADSVGLSEMFTLRQGDIRKQFIELFDGSIDSEVSVNRGLQWLIDHQNQDGSWSLNNFHVNCQGKHPNCTRLGTVQSNSAATGLAMLPLLAAGNTHQFGDFQVQMAAAIKWFTEVQQEDGRLFGPGVQQMIYSHSIATIAVCEAYGMTKDPALKPMVERALNFLVQAQHQPTGGWRYLPNQGSDTSVVGWAMMALKSGEMAGIQPPPAAINNVAKWLAFVEGNKPVGGLFGYQTPGVSPAMTAEGLLCLQFMNTGRNEARMRAGADYLLQHLPEPNQSRTSYYWYYGTQVMYHMQGDYWKAWNTKLRDHLVQTQIKDGHMAGTWEPRDNWENSGGRLYTTALKLLMLEVYYRHLPLYEQLDE
ncbi:MAG: hypothetical protein MK165_06550 [Pirellulaceae bacterium]|nr:hypothetical protein [Pirellulaceae bacterium]